MTITKKQIEDAAQEYEAASKIVNQLLRWEQGATRLTTHGRFHQNDIIRKAIERQHQAAQNIAAIAIKAIEETPGHQ